MPSYNLTQTQNEIITSWLFEPGGYLDAAIADTDESAFAALQADAGLDVTQWIRDNTKHADTYQGDWDQCAMVWWIRENDQVNVPTPQLPPESAAWVAILAAWDESINTGLGKVGQGARDANAVDIFGTDQTLIGTQPAGSHLAQQQQIISKVTAVLS